MVYLLISHQIRRLFIIGFDFILDSGQIYVYTYKSTYIYGKYLTGFIDGGGITSKSHLR